MSNLIHDRQNRGQTKTGWLDSYHTFSFGGFHDPNRMGFRSLRVINEDRVVPGAGFDTHSHSDMEIVTYVLEGALAHEDSLGTGTVISAGEVQIMSAGIGISHSEFNPSKTDLVHFLQIWIVPNIRGVEATYQQQAIPLEEKRGKLRLIAAEDGRDDAIAIHQDIELYLSFLESGDVINYHLKPNRYAWLQLTRGVATLNGNELRAGDGVQLSGKEQLEIATHIGAEILLLDLA